jgi:small-conductance mechanosensitive channel
VDFEVGDEVIVGETPTQGVIESLDARRVRLRDKDGILHIIPNSIVERKEWVLVHRRQEMSTLARAVKTARKIKRVALKQRDPDAPRQVRKNDRYQP